jgi:BlaI family penicillinase repressor
MKLPRISEAEWDVMEVIWKNHPTTSTEIVTALTREKAWAANTVRTMLARLVQKKVLTFTTEGKTYRYRPLISREKCVRQMSHSFLERVFAGATASLLLHFAKTQPLTRKELAELEAVLRQKGKGK